MNCRRGRKFPTLAGDSSGSITLAHNKQEKKKKERERRVAQKKADESRRLAEELAAKDAKPAAKSGKVFAASLTAPIENAPPKSTETSTLRPTPN